MALVVLFAIALKKHNKELAKIERIPEVALTTINGEEVLLAESKPGWRTAILFFSHDCEFCRKEIEGIIVFKDTFLNTNWIFVTMSPREELDYFLMEFPLENIDGAKVCVENFPELAMALHVTSPPSLFIYNSDGYIEHYKRGVVSIRTILEWLK